LSPTYSDQSEIQNHIHINEMNNNRVNYKTPRSKDKLFLNSNQTYTPSSNRDFNIKNFLFNVPASNNISSDVNYLSPCDDEKI